MSSRFTPPAGRGTYRLKLTEGQQQRVYVSTYRGGFMLFEAQYRERGYAPDFDALPTKQEWQTSRERS